LTPDPVEATPEPGKKTRKRRAWQPEARDHYIYHLVKFEGHTQGEAASMQRISQATVSRIIDRYERWQAHADPREGGRLDPAERLRAQRWLTYERNELILGSALRIARAVEGTAELWKTVRTEPGDPYRRDKASVKDETTMIDRTGVAARFLRLAFKVNMEQLALVEKDPPPLPGALNAEEIAEEERQDAAVAEEFRRQERLLAATKPGPGESAEGEMGREGEGETTSAEGSPAANAVPSTQYRVLGTEYSVPNAVAGGGLSEAPTVAAPATSLLNLHTLHNGGAENSGASDLAAEACASQAPADKKPADSCIAEIDKASPPRRRGGIRPRETQASLACASG
jgi:hypothetical protein